jgi:hypothetical protein
MRTKANTSRRPEVVIALVLLPNGRLRLSCSKDIVVGVLRDVDEVLIIGASELSPGIPRDGQVGACGLGQVQNPGLLPNRARTAVVTASASLFATDTLIRALAPPDSSGDNPTLPVNIMMACATP